MEVSAPGPFYPLWVTLATTGQCVQGRKARCGFGAGRQVMLRGENVTEPDCAQRLTKVILKMTPFLVGSIAVYNTD